MSQCNSCVSFPDSHQIFQLSGSMFQQQDLKNVSHLLFHWQWRNNSWSLTEGNGDVFSTQGYATVELGEDRGKHFYFTLYWTGAIILVFLRLGFTLLHSLVSSSQNVAHSLRNFEILWNVRRVTCEMLISPTKKQRSQETLSTKHWSFFAHWILFPESFNADRLDCRVSFVDSPAVELTHPKNWLSSWLNENYRHLLWLSLLHFPFLTSLVRRRLSLWHVQFWQNWQMAPKTVVQWLQILPGLETISATWRW